MKLALLVAALLSPLCACSERGEAASARGRVVDSSAGTVALGILSVPYRAIGPGPGALSGTITLPAGSMVHDSLVPVVKDATVCGDSASLSPVGGTGNDLANVLVWVSGITAGKPLPELRRQTLTVEKCQFQPRVMGVVAKTTVNVYSNDKAVHKLRFYREGEGPIEHIRTVDEGQVVPSEKIASEPGIVEVRCTEHPFTRAYVAVFDHPYFAVTDADGAFTIDGLPPGTYTVKVWHERLEHPAEQRVVVGPGGTARLDATLQLK